MQLSIIMIQDHVRNEESRGRSLWGGQFESSLWGGQFESGDCATREVDQWAHLAPISSPDPPSPTPLWHTVNEFHVLLPTTATKLNVLPSTRHVVITLSTIRRVTV